MPPHQNQSTSRIGRVCHWGRVFIAMGLLTGLISIVLVFYLASGQNSSPPSTLLFASVLFRHGDRTPTETYPLDPYQSDQFWPEGFGQLTKTGKKHSYDLGVWIRTKYAELVPTRYSADNIYVTSSDYDRCIMTAQLLLAGLYPPQTDQIWKDDLAWQPVPVHTTPLALDQLIVMKKPCPRYDYELSKLRNSTTVSEEELKLFRFLTNHTGEPINDVLDTEFLYNTLEIEEKRGLELPPWTKSVYPEPMRTIAARSLAVFTNNTALQRLRAGPMIKQIIARMSSKASAAFTGADRRLDLYSGHDITLVSVLQALGVVGTLYKPDPAAALLLELHRPDSQNQQQDYLVKVFYLKNATVADAELIHTRCSSPCTLAGFIDAMNPITPLNWDEECSLQPSGASAV